MWKRKKAKKKDASDKAQREPELAPPSVADAPTQPAPRRNEDDATVWQGQSPADDSTGKTEPDSESGDAPRPAEADAPTVAIRPEFKRQLPDAPSVAGASMHSPEQGAEVEPEETVQVGRRSPPDPTQAPQGADGHHPTQSEGEPDSSGDEPTVPMGRRRN